ncbi:RRXRR domain-containing protein [Thiorhodococcus minor]|uniref:RRXRR domain-containing protein n=1 Tax=Thiorhodococcus minor TaxID=57489 RepID=A0A6M0JVI8_9GAMM|nr:RRXRR domain-containing protein [Thiorhodococcus minor]NEV60337.1 hypothetical protein [Thiorhodococcus minor]
MTHRFDFRFHLQAQNGQRRHYLSVPRGVFQSFIRLPVQARDATLERALASVQGRARVLVCDANRVLLNPCHPARARELIRRGRGRLVSVQPPVLQLHRAVANHQAEELG